MTQCSKNLRRAIPAHRCRDIATAARHEIRIRCRVATHHKTGVEMEALTGATVAALTIYDMCKALSHAIRIVDVRLLSKRGGRRTVAARAARPHGRRT